MTVYLGPGVAAWPRTAPHSIVWLPTAPVVGKPDYPVALDVAESARVLAPTALVSAAAAAIAPSWEDLASQGLATTAISRPRWDDIQEQDDDAIEQFVLGGLAQAVASLGPGYGVILHHLERYDHASAVFTTRLFREARHHGLHLAINAPLRLGRDPRYQEYLQHVEVVAAEPSRQRGSFSEMIPHAAALVALCPQGLPLRILARLTDSLDASAYEEGVGPGGEPWAWLPLSRRRRLLTRLTPQVRQALHAQLFDAWAPSGWGYLRRAGHAIASATVERMLAQHTPYLLGIATIGRDFLYKQLLGLIRVIRDLDPHTPDALNVLVGAARLAPRTRGKGGFRAAARYYQRAIHCCSNPVDKAALIYEIANIYALQRDAAALACARAWYAHGYACLQQIDDTEARLRTEIRLANGLALVAYHEGHNHEALALEHRARAIVREAEGQYPHIDDWATPLLNTNTAKLLVKRFADIAAAIPLLEQNVVLGPRSTQTKSRVDLSRLYFDQGNHRRVVDLLSEIYDKHQPGTFNEREELFGRLMFALSLIALDERDRARCQLNRLVYLCHTTSSAGASQIVAMIQRAASSVPDPRQT